MNSIDKIKNQPLECSFLSDSSFIKDCISLRKTYWDKDQDITWTQYIELCKEDIPLLLNCINQIFGTSLGNCNVGSSTNHS